MGWRLVLIERPGPGVVRGPVAQGQTPPLRGQSPLPFWGGAGMNRARQNGAGPVEGFLRDAPGYVA
ncbi:MAG: hypothetical protein U5J63_04445 [Fodinibius sp.]|nr:hypothetical protein [Fodinibius sp.]